MIVSTFITLQNKGSEITRNIRISYRKVLIIFGMYPVLFDKIVSLR